MKATTEDPNVIYVIQRGNGMAVGALVCGLVGIVLGLIPILFFFAWGLGIVAFVLGLIARRRGRDPNVGRRTMALWGVLLGMASVGMGVVGYITVQNILS